MELGAAVVLKKAAAMELGCAAVELGAAWAGIWAASLIPGVDGLGVELCLCH